MCVLSSRLLTGDILARPTLVGVRKKRITHDGYRYHIIQQSSFKIRYVAVLPRRAPQIKRPHGGERHGFLSTVELAQMVGTVY